MQGPGKVGMDRVLRPDAFRSNAAWNPWFTPAYRRPCSKCCKTGMTC